MRFDHDLHAPVGRLFVDALLRPKTWQRFTFVTSAHCTLHSFVLPSPCGTAAVAFCGACLDVGETLGALRPPPVLSMSSPFCLEGSLRIGAPVVDREAGVENKGAVDSCARVMPASAKARAVTRATLAAIPILTDMHTSPMLIMLTICVPWNSGRVKLAKTLLII